MTRRITPLALVLVAATLPACSSGNAIMASLNEGIYRLRGGAGPGGMDEVAVDVGLESGFSAKIVIDGLQNPSGVTFDHDGALTVCDSGNGRVLVVNSGRVQEYVTGFATEHWKVDPATGTKRFKLGPLSAAWLPDGRLAVTDGGVKDGHETIRFYEGPGDAANGKPTNSVGPTTDAAGDAGEGNLTGLSKHPDGRLFLCGQGADAATWILSATTGDSPTLHTFASADRAGIDVNSPMETLVTPHGNVLVLYSGAGGKDDGLIALWHGDTGALLGKWTLPGLTDPMGMAFVPGTAELVVVDNNWALTEVKTGKLARVTLPGIHGGDASSEATVKIVGSALRGPVSCAFGPDGRLYIAELGAQFDKDLGRVIAVSGF